MRRQKYFLELLLRQKTHSPSSSFPVEVVFITVLQVLKMFALYLIASSSNFTSSFQSMAFAFDDSNISTQFWAFNFFLITDGLFALLCPLKRCHLTTTYDLNYRFPQQSLCLQCLPSVACFWVIIFVFLFEFFLLTFFHQRSSF